MKLKVLIIDDEERICKLVGKLIHWEELPLEPMGCALDGESGLARIQAERPQIVITDIRMPGMTGLEIIEKCKGLGLSTRFIIISGYTQFEYAYSAIKYGVEDFLLKPIGEEELNSSLQRLCDEILLQQGAVPRDPAFVSPSLERSFLAALAAGQLTPQEYDVAHIERYFHLRLTCDCFLLGKLHLDKRDTSGAYIYHLLDAFSQKLHESLSPHCQAVVDYPQGEQLLFLLNYPHADQRRLLRQLQHYFEDALALVQPYQFMALTLAVAPDILDFKDVPRALPLVDRLIDSRYALGSNAMLDSSMVRIPLAELPAYPPDFRPRLLEGLKNLNPEEGKAILRVLYREGIPNIADYPYLLIDHARRLSQMALSCLDDIVQLGESRTRYQESLTRQLDACGQKDELLNRILSFFGSLLLELQTEYQSAESKVIAAVKDYVRAHFHERLELEDVAGEVFLNPVYLGTFFKRETGMNFSEYLVSVRIDKAKELLRNVRYNIGEIAGLVGYKDANHFSKVFQKHVGIKPNEYRKLRHRQQPIS